MSPIDLVLLTCIAYFLAMMVLVGDIPIGLIDRKTLMPAIFLSIIPAAFVFIMLASL